MSSQCGVLQKRLEHSIECRLVLEASIKQAQDTINNLQEELTTTTTNYEIQLSSLSEHVANMNDKLTLQQEEIESLTFQLTTKVSICSFENHFLFTWEMLINLIIVKTENEFMFFLLVFHYSLFISLTITNSYFFLF